MDELLAGCLAGEKAAWDAFVDRYAGAIFAAVGRVLRGRGVAGQEAAVEDVSQDVFLRLVKDDFHLLRGYDSSRASLVTWLTIVARSTAIDFLRRRRLATVALADAPPVAARPEAAEEPGAGVVAENVPPGLLTPRQELVLRLSFERELDAEAIAALMGISPQTVRSTKHKALQKLRDHFSTRQRP